MTLKETVAREKIGHLDLVNLPNRTYSFPFYSHITA